MQSISTPQGDVGQSKTLTRELSAKLNGIKTFDPASGTLSLLSPHIWTDGSSTGETLLDYSGLFFAGFRSGHSPSCNVMEWIIDRIYGPVLGSDSEKLVRKRDISSYMIFFCELWVEKVFCIRNLRIGLRVSASEKVKCAQLITILCTLCFCFG